MMKIKKGKGIYFNIGFTIARGRNAKVMERVKRRRGHAPLLSRFCLLLKVLAWFEGIEYEGKIAFHTNVVDAMHLIG